METRIRLAILLNYDGIEHVHVPGPSIDIRFQIAKRTSWCLLCARFWCENKNRNSNQNLHATEHYNDRIVLCRATIAVVQSARQI